MATRTVVVTAAEGLHARSAALVVRLATQLPTRVTIRRPDGAPVPTTSILSVLALGVGPGDQVVLEADGPEAEAAVDALAAQLTGT